MCCFSSLLCPARWVSRACWERSHFPCQLQPLFLLALEPKAMLLGSTPLLRKQLRRQSLTMRWLTSLWNKKHCHSRHYICCSSSTDKLYLPFCSYSCGQRCVATRSSGKSSDSAGSIWSSWWLSTRDTVTLLTDPMSKKTLPQLHCLSVGMKGRAHYAFCFWKWKNYPNSLQSEVTLSFGFFLPTEQWRRGVRLPAI